MWVGGAGYLVIIIIIMVFIFIVDKEARPVLQPVLIGVASIFALLGVTVLAIYLPKIQKAFQN